MNAGCLISVVLFVLSGAALVRAKGIPAMPTTQRGTLTERLAVSEDAHHKRRITEEECRELGKQLLDQFANG
jgi:hypothetical protein